MPTTFPALASKLQVIQHVQVLLHFLSKRLQAETEVTAGGRNFLKVGLDAFRLCAVQLERLVQFLESMGSRIVEQRQSIGKALVEMVVDGNVIVRGSSKRRIPEDFG